LVAIFFTEDFEHTVLDRAIRKLHWFQYVHDNLFILHYGPEKLKGFPDQLNTHHQNTQFNMEMATFLDIDIYKGPDGSLYYKVYCKTHPHQPLPEFSTHYNPSKIFCRIFMHVSDSINVIFK
jgi:hypothetical protein